LAVTGLMALARVAGAQPPASTHPELQRFSVVSDRHAVAVWARIPPAPGGVMLFVHGRTWSSRPDFDLQVPAGNRSVLSSFASRGIAAYAVDLRGYGGTARDASGWNTPRQSARDVANVLAWIGRRHPGLPRPGLTGWSRGAAVGMLAAQLWPERIAFLVMFGFVPDPDLAFSDAEAGVVPERRPNTREAAASDFISPGVTPAEVVTAFVVQALAADPVLVDARNDAELNALDPRRLRVPTLVIFGERDPSVSAAAVARFMA